MISKNTKKSPAWLINTSYVDSKPLVAYGYSSRTRGGTYGTTAQHTHTTITRDNATSH